MVKNNMTRAVPALFFLNKKTFSKFPLENPVLPKLGLDANPNICSAKKVLSKTNSGKAGFSSLLIVDQKRSFKTNSEKH